MNVQKGTNVFRVAAVTVLGSGFAPFAPGTWGSGVAVVLWAAMWLACAAGGLPRLTVEILTLAGVFASCHYAVKFGPWAIAVYGRKDPRQFVLDEFAGQWVALLVVPALLGIDLWSLACIVGGQFVLFRIFDVLKPPPARQAEALPAGWGILTDDLLAGMYANIAGQLLWRFTPLAAGLGARLTAG